MSLTLIDGTVTVVTPKVAKSFEFLRSECERLNSELAAMTAAKDKAVEALKTALGMIERQEADVDYYICDEALREREHIEHLIAELEEVK